MDRCIKFIKYLLKVRVFYTAYFNLRYLPLKQGIKIPIVFFHRARMIISNGGKIYISPNMKGRILIGGYQLSFAHGTEFTTIRNKGGKIYFHEGTIWIQSGNIWYVSGEVHLWGDNMFGNNTQVSCYKKIDVQVKVRIAHQCQLRDSNFHYLRDTITGQINPISTPVNIGTCCWIGNRTTIMPGTVLPNYTIVGSNSLLNKDYSKIISSYSLIAGMPAKFIRGNIERVSFVDIALEKKLYVEEFSVYFNKI